MLRSMYSGISGMRANQTKMDVIANNTANVGTTAFKKSTARFTDALYQNEIYASGPSGVASNALVLGGISPGQVGIGVRVSGIFKNMVQGALQPTGRPTDLGIDGDGFFPVSMGAGQIAYTRDGSFSLDTNGNLVTADGYKVITQVAVDDGTGNIVLAQQGNPAYTVDVDGDGAMDGCAVQIPKDIYRIPMNVTPPAPLKTGDSLIRRETGNLDATTGLPIYEYSTLDGGTVIDQATFDALGDVPLIKVVNFNIAKDGKISYLLEDGTKVPKTNTSGQPVEGYQQIVLSAFQNPEGLEQLAGNMYGVTANSGNPVPSTSLGVINQGTIEMSNVDLSAEFTEMIVTQRAFQASSKIITTSDELLQEIMGLKR